MAWACAGAEDAERTLPGATGPLAGNDSDGRVSAVRHWLYLIDVNLDQRTVERIAQSEHDLVVLDFIPSERENTGYPMAEVVNRLHAGPRARLVLAYIDIGEAEDYRTYWRAGWRVGNPAWILGDDPDGWEGNFPVAYWEPAWKEIWVGTGGYIEAIVAAGFDGIYLDWVEAYSDETVASAAADAGLDPRAEMIAWVASLAEATRALRPDAIVIAQNAAELADDDTYLLTIDAIAQEQVWFDGGADNDPPGDCPLPATVDDVEGDDYLAALSPVCRRQHDRFKDGTLHTSSEEYLALLSYARQRGERVFTVDYALDPVNVATAHRNSRSMGFVSFVGSRGLDSFVEPFPYAPGN